jgi:hypothetical protein
LNKRECTGRGRLGQIATCLIANNHLLTLGKRPKHAETARGCHPTVTPAAPTTLHSPSFEHAARSAVQAPSFAPAGAREGGGREGGCEEAAGKAIPPVQREMELFPVPAAQIPPPIPPAPFHPRQGGKGSPTADLVSPLNKRECTRQGQLGQGATEAIANYHLSMLGKRQKHGEKACYGTPAKKPAAPTPLHSPSFEHAAKSAVQAPSFAPAGAREGGGREGGK